SHISRFPASLHASPAPGGLHSFPTRRSSDLLTMLGFGFIEIGTVTAHPQPGNEKPRMWRELDVRGVRNRMGFNNEGAAAAAERLDRKSTRLNSSHVKISYAVFCLKKKINNS